MKQTKAIEEKRPNWTKANWKYWKYIDKLVKSAGEDEKKKVREAIDKRAINGVILADIKDLKKELGL